jgi:adenosylcobinamide kinase/adenosylcobinamide-phosphate guanylyltransferase
LNVLEQYQKSVLLVLGGVRSGKSRFAVNFASTKPAVIFLATARSSDSEMAAKIRRHRKERPDHWTTIEEPLDLASILLRDDASHPLIVIDCLTLYAANLLEAYGEDAAGIENEIARFCDALRASPCSVLLVSNEVGSGIVPAYAAGRRFRDLLGEINQRVAALSDTAVLMIAGLPLALKGQLEADV